MNKQEGVTATVPRTGERELMEGSEAIARASIPPYRTQHIASNETAMRTGFAAVDPLTSPAWDKVETPA